MNSIETIVRSASPSRRLGRWPATVALLALGAACSSSSSNDGGTMGTVVDSGTCPYMQLSQSAPAATCGSPGGPTPGPQDTHCGSGATAMVQATGVCVGVPDAAATPASGDDANVAMTMGSDAASGDDAGLDAAAGDDAGNDGTCGETGYGPTNYGQSAGDDDCKYDVSWTSTAVCVMGNVYFTVTIKKRAGADGKPALSNEPPLTGASVDLEVIHSDCATIATNSGTTSEQGSGVYKIGPVVFPKSGKWSVRFHINGCCSDVPQDSPHGHAAFWVNVP